MVGPPHTRPMRQRATAKVQPSTTAVQRAAIIKHVKTLMRCSGRVIKYAGVEYAALKFVVVSQVLSSSKGTWRSGEGPTGLNWKLDINLCLFAKCYFFFHASGQMESFIRCVE